MFVLIKNIHPRFYVFVKKKYPSMVLCFCYPFCPWIFKGCNEVVRWRWALFVGFFFPELIAWHLNEKNEDNEEKKKGKESLSLFWHKRTTCRRIIIQHSCSPKYEDGDVYTHVNNIKLLDGSVASLATQAEIFAAANRFYRIFFC